MPPERFPQIKRALTAAALLACMALPQPAHAYSVMTHEEVVDMAWLQHMVPLLRARYPSLTDDQIREAHAFAYGGCILQDLGYYPKGSAFFSDLTHYVRSGDFVQALLNDATTPDEFAFAMGALAHYTSDETGHPYVNQVTAQEFPKLEHRYGPIVTYEESPSHHLRTEFGFDVVGVSRGKYAQIDYRNFIGFEVAKPLLERAFEETYGLKLTDVIHDEDASIGAARWAVHSLIPKITRVALLTYHDNIEHANPGFDRSKFQYRMSRTEYEKSWGKKYNKPGFGSHLMAILITILPKVGPLKALKLKLPDADQQTLYIKSVNETVDRLDARLDKMRSVITAVPVPVVAQSNGKSPDAGTATADKATETAANARGEAKEGGAIVATSVAVAAADPAPAEPVQSAKADSGDAAQHPATPAVQAAATAAQAGVDPAQAGAAIAQPLGDVPLTLTSIDLDTGKTTAPGEYGLADKTYAELLEKVAVLPSIPADALLRKDLLLYFGADQAAKNSLSKNPKDWAKVQNALAQMKAAPAAPPVTQTTGD
ncbi:zinc dependent phospholipase C family protein [Terriglobus roseus]|uniref:Zinc dependent phospholipase C n=1 Tax=Terriglobus roseus TaxID=392734 RepID=A0A1H4LW89_9BACT|nr:zinc dependent phospholipase C family protein [Terriglobus roseus]SEB74784.1 Zinc dependent phospholipase C [Terriglobus roseus]